MSVFRYRRFSGTPAACQLIALKKQTTGQSDQAADQK
jgi:hypothetical protein